MRIRSTRGSRRSRTFYGCAKRQRRLDNNDVASRRAHRWAASLPAKEGVFSVGDGKAELSFTHSHTQNKQFRTPERASFSWLPSSRLTTCIPTNHTFLNPISTLNKAIIRSRSPMSQSVDIASNDLARPSSDPLILITPSSIMRAADIATPVTSKIFFNLLAPKWTLIAHRIKFAGDQVEVPGEGVVEHSQQVLLVSTGLH